MTLPQISLLLLLLGGHVTILVLGDITCELKQIQQCTNDFWWMIRSKTYKDVQQQMTDGCGFWQVYEDCLGAHICHTSNSIDYYLAPLDVQINDDGTMTIGQGNETAPVKKVVFNTSISIIDGNHLVSQEDEEENRKRRKRSTDKSNEKKKTEAPPSRKFPTPAVWKYLILETGVFFNKITLCDTLDNKALLNVPIVADIVKYRGGVDLVEAEESKCYKSYECFTDLMTSAADEDSTHPCDIFSTFITCQETSNKECTEKASLHYVRAIKSIWLPLLEEFGKIPEFCDSFAKNLTQITK